MRLGTAYWLTVPSPCCHRHHDVLSLNKYKAQSFDSNPPNMKVEWGMREKPSGSQKPCEPEIHVQTLLLPQTHQNFPQHTVFSYYHGEGESFPQAPLPVERCQTPSKRLFLPPEPSFSLWLFGGSWEIQLLLAQSRQGWIIKCCSWRHVKWPSGSHAELLAILLLSV